MKKLNKNIGFLLVIMLAASPVLHAQDEEKPEMVIALKYFAKNNNLQYLKVSTQTKQNRKIEAAPNVSLQIFLNEEAPENLVAKVKTDGKGEAKAIIPANLKDNWQSSPLQKFIAVSEATKTVESTTSELEITKAKIVLDTLNEDGERKVTAKVLKLVEDEWIPEGDVELKIGVQRSASVLMMGEEESYTTDSLGEAVGDFTLDSIPGDDKGNLVLVARTEDNDLFGSISTETLVPWGVPVKAESTFGQRSLWATRDKAPIWLLAMAFTIIGLVWGVLIYLVIQLIKMIRLGKAAPVQEEKVPARTSVVSGHKELEEKV